MQIEAADLHPDAAIQYVALYLIQELNRRGRVIGNLPTHLLDRGERKIVQDIFRAGMSFTDVEIEAALVACTYFLREQGYEADYSMAEAMKELKR